MHQAEPLSESYLADGQIWSTLKKFFQLQLWSYGRDSSVHNNPWHHGTSHN